MSSFYQGQVVRLPDGTTGTVQTSPVAGMAESAAESMVSVMVQEQGQSIVRLFDEADLMEQLQT